MSTSLPLFPADATKIASCLKIAILMASCRKEGHCPCPTKDMDTILAGNGFVGTPTTETLAPTAHKMALATSLAYPCPQRLRTLTGSNVMLGCMDRIPGTRLGLPAMMDPIMVPWYGAGHVSDNTAPGSSTEGPHSLSEAKLYPSAKFSNSVSMATCAKPVSRIATTALAFPVNEKLCQTASICNE